MAGRRHAKKTPRESLTCKTATSLIAKYISADLDPKVELSFEEHLRACPDCVAFLNTYKKTLELARSFLGPGLEDSRLEGMEARIEERIRKQRVNY